MQYTFTSFINRSNNRTEVSACVLSTNTMEVNREEKRIKELAAKQGTDLMHYFTSLPQER